VADMNYTSVYIYICIYDFFDSLMNLHMSPMMLLGPTMDLQVAHAIFLRIPRLSNFLEVLIFQRRCHEFGGSGLLTIGETGVTADRDKIEFRLFNSSSIFNITLREDLFSSPKKNQPCCLVLVSWR